MWGLCAAAIMGTDTAYVYDVLAREGLAPKASRVLTNSTSLALAGAGLGSVFGAILASSVGFRAVFLYNAVFFAFSLAMALLLEGGRPSVRGRAAPRLTRRTGAGPRSARSGVVRRALCGLWDCRGRRFPRSHPLAVAAGSRSSDSGSAVNEFGDLLEGMLGRRIQMVDRERYAGHLDRRRIIRPPRSYTRFAGKQFDGPPIGIKHR